MKRKSLITAAVFVFGLTCTRSGVESSEAVSLPAPNLKGSVSLEESVKARRSVRSYSAKALSLEQVSQIMWAGQGITGDRDFHRSAPSAGGLHPLELYLAVKAGGVEGLSAGVYHYITKEHKLEPVKDKERNSDIARAALGQMWTAQAPVIVIMTADYSRTTVKYGQRGIRYVHIDTGLAAENIILQAVALGLSTCPVGAFDDKELAEVIGLPESLQPMLIIAMGHR